jgi:hypothetical protein
VRLALNSLRRARRCSKPKPLPAGTGSHPARRCTGENHCKIKAARRAGAVRETGRGPEAECSRVARKAATPRHGHAISIVLLRRAPPVGAGEGRGQRGAQAMWFGRFLAHAFALAAVALVAASAAKAQSPRAKGSSCSQSNVACQCSYRCCGEERCDGQVCNQCVIDCVQRRQPGDERFNALRARCGSIMTRGFRRL